MIALKEELSTEKSEKRPAPLLKLVRIQTCNICEKKFKVKSQFTRFCDSCRIENEEYLYSDWMPLAG